MEFVADISTADCAVPGEASSSAWTVRAKADGGVWEGCLRAGRGHPWPNSILMPLTPEPDTPPKPPASFTAVTARISAGEAENAAQLRTFAVAPVPADLEPHVRHVRIAALHFHSPVSFVDAEAAWARAVSGIGPDAVCISGLDPSLPASTGGPLRRLDTAHEEEGTDLTEPPRPDRTHRVWTSSSAGEAPRQSALAFTSPLPVDAARSYGAHKPHPRHLRAVLPSPGLAVYASDLTGTEGGDAAAVRRGLQFAKAVHEEGPPKAVSLAAWLITCPTSGSARALAAAMARFHWASAPTLPAARCDLDGGTGPVHLLLRKGNLACRAHSLHARTCAEDCASVAAWTLSRVALPSEGDTAQGSVPAPSWSTPAPAPALVAAAALRHMRQLAQSQELVLGVAVKANALAKEPRYAQAVASLFNCVTPENAMKWGSLQPEGPSDWRFGTADRIVAFAEAHGMLVKGHALAWHGSLPPWAKGRGAEEVWGAAKAHCRRAAARYRGRVAMWDVVNEALVGGGWRRNSPLFQARGKEFVGEAFRIAHAADPEALLMYNDYLVADVCPKSDAMAAHLSSMLAAGIPVHGVGLQSHLRCAGMPALSSAFDNAARLAALGLGVCISELDLRVKGVPGSPAQVAQVQRRCVRDCVLAVALGARKGAAQWHATATPQQRQQARCPGFIGVTLWGLTDAHSWVHSFFGADAPLLVDGEYAPKPAMVGLAEALIVLASSASPLEHCPRPSPPAAAWAAAGAAAEPASLPQGPRVSPNERGAWELPAQDCAAHKGCSVGARLASRVRRGGWLAFRVALPPDAAVPVTAVAEVACPAPETVQLRADSPSGPLLASVRCERTGGYSSYGRARAPLAWDGRRGDIDVYVVFVADDACNLRGVTLEPADASS